MRVGKCSKIVNYSLKIVCILFILIAQLFVDACYNNSKVNASEIGNQLDQIYISEENYSEDMKDTVEPYINNKLEYGYIDGAEDVKLYYEKYNVENAKANIVICHGFSESLEKYHEMIY